MNLTKMEEGMFKNGILNQFYGEAFFFLLYGKSQREKGKQLYITGARNTIDFFIGDKKLNFFAIDYEMIGDKNISCANDFLKNQKAIVKLATNKTNCLRTIQEIKNTQGLPYLIVRKFLEPVDYKDFRDFLHDKVENFENKKNLFLFQQELFNSKQFDKLETHYKNTFKKRVPIHNCVFDSSELREKLYYYGSGKLNKYGDYELFQQVINYKKSFSIKTKLEKENEQSRF